MVFSCIRKVGKALDGNIEWHKYVLEQINSRKYWFVNERIIDTAFHTLNYLYEFQLMIKEKDDTVATLNKKIEELEVCVQQVEAKYNVLSEKHQDNIARIDGAYKNLKDATMKLQGVQS